MKTLEYYIDWLLDCKLDLKIKIKIINDELQPIEGPWENIFLKTSKYLVMLYIVSYSSQITSFTSLDKYS